MEFVGALELVCCSLGGNRLAWLHPMVDVEVLYPSWTGVSLFSIRILLMIILVATNDVSILSLSS